MTKQTLSTDGWRHFVILPNDKTLFISLFQNQSLGHSFVSIRTRIVSLTLFHWRHRSCAMFLRYSDFQRAKTIDC